MTSSQIVINEIGLCAVNEVANIHLGAFPKSALSSLGFEAVRRYYEWQLIGPHDVLPLGAYLDETMAGFCIGGIFRGAMGGFLRKNRTFLISRTIIRPWVVFNPLIRNRIRSALKILSQKPSAPPKPGKAKVRSFSILAIAVHPTYQGLGIGKILMETSEDFARNNGYEKMHLTVDPGNTQAIGFYERLGWQKISVSLTWSGQMEKRL
jgi:ribosomal protein S18 acetylase RimI-like enzyme